MWSTLIKVKKDEKIVKYHLKFLAWYGYGGQLDYIVPLMGI